MSNFNYLPEKIEHYAPLVIAYIENNPKGSNPISEGYIKATDGIDYKIDTKKGGKFDIFKSKVRSKEKKRFINLAKWLKDPQNQFKIESDDSRYPDKTQRSNVDKELFKKLNKEVKKKLITTDKEMAEFCKIPLWDKELLN